MNVVFERYYQEHKSEVFSAITYHLGWQIFRLSVFWENTCDARWTKMWVIYNSAKYRKIAQLKCQQSMETFTIFKFQPTHQRRSFEFSVQRPSVPSDKKIFHKNQPIINVWYSGPSCVGLKDDVLFTMQNYVLVCLHFWM